MIQDNAVEEIQLEASLAVPPPRTVNEGWARPKLNASTGSVLAPRLGRLSITMETRSGTFSDTASESELLADPDVTSTCLELPTPLGVEHAIEVAESHSVDSQVVPSTRRRLDKPDPPNKPWTTSLVCSFEATLLLVCTELMITTSAL
eukprot:1804532-Rhodomonas_salina.2